MKSTSYRVIIFAFDAVERVIHVDGASEPKGTFTIPEVTFANLSASSKAIEEKKTKRWVREIFQEWKNLGHYYTLVQGLILHDRLHA